MYCWVLFLVELNDLIRSSVNSIKNLITHLKCLFSKTKHFWYGYVWLLCVMLGPGTRRARKEDSQSRVGTVPLAGTWMRWWFNSALWRLCILCITQRLSFLHFVLFLLAGVRASTPRWRGQSGGYWAPWRERATPSALPPLLHHCWPEKLPQFQLWLGQLWLVISCLVFDPWTKIKLNIF